MNDNFDNKDTVIIFQTEINNLIKISQALETFPMTGSNNMIGFGSCVQSLNMTIGNLIKYNQKECGEVYEPSKTDK